MESFHIRYYACYGKCDYGETVEATMEVTEEEHAYLMQVLQEWKNSEDYEDTAPEDFVDFSKLLPDFRDRMIAGGIREEYSYLVAEACFTDESQEEFIERVCSEEGEDEDDLDEDFWDRVAYAQSTICAEFPKPEDWY